MSFCSFHEGGNKHLRPRQRLNRNKTKNSASDVMYQNPSRSNPSCSSLVLYLDPRVSCSVPAVRDTVHCSSILFPGCRTGRFGCRRQSDRRQRSQCSTLPGHSPLSLIGRRCLSASAAEQRETQMVMFRLLKYVHSHITGQMARSDSV